MGRREGRKRGRREEGRERIESGKQGGEEGGEWEQGGVEKRERDWERRKGDSARHNLNLL